MGINEMKAIGNQPLCIALTQLITKQTESTCRPHFGSSLLVVTHSTWRAGQFLVLQITYVVPPHLLKCTMRKKHLVFSGTKRYSPKQAWWSGNSKKGLSLINKFPVDSAIRIPSGGRYSVPLGEYEKFEKKKKIKKTAILRHLPEGEFKIRLR